MPEDHSCGSFPECHYLDLDAEWKLHRDFLAIPLTGVLADVLRRDVDVANITEGEIDETFEGIVTQLRGQHIEFETMVTMTVKGCFLLQIQPSAGRTDRVSNDFIVTPEGSTPTLDLHNHPVDEGHDVLMRSFAFFSGRDLSKFIFAKKPFVATAVVFEEGTAIMIRNAESDDFIQQIILSLDPHDHSGRAVLRNNLEKKFLKEVTSDTFSARRAFSITTAQEYKMKLWFIKKGTRQIEVLA